MKNLKRNWLFYLLALLLTLTAGCRSKATQTPQPSQTPAPTITYCDIDPASLCLEGFGQNDEGQTLILFKAADQDFRKIFVRAEVDAEEIDLVCNQSQSFPENIYCQGSVFPAGEKIKLNIFSTQNKTLIAVGVFSIEYASLPTPDVDFAEAAATATQAAIPENTEYPNYPNYPNDYQNP
jgi:hypothetical protein